MTIKAFAFLEHIYRIFFQRHNFKSINLNISWRLVWIQVLCFNWPMLWLLHHIMMMMLNCFSSIFDRQKTFCLISSRDHCQRSPPLHISNTPGAGFNTAWNLTLSFFEWRFAVVATTTSLCHWISFQTFLTRLIMKMQNICNLNGWNSVHVTDLFNYYSTDINGIWNARKLDGI